MVSVLLCNGCSPEGVVRHQKKDLKIFLDSILQDLVLTRDGKNPGILKHGKKLGNLETLGIL